MVAQRRLMAARAGAALFLCGALLVAGCSTRAALYDWGEYEQVVYEGLKSPDGAEVGGHVARLRADLERIEASERRVPPGLHAHLGYLYANQRQFDLARRHFQIEKQLFPEASSFMDRAIARMPNE